MSSKFSKWTVVPAAVLLLGTVTLAQDPASSGSNSSGSATTSTTPAAKPTVGQRKENQQDRIAQGVKSGQLTAGETANLETKEAAINGETKADRAANGGKLTQAEKKQINQQQNQLSNQIYKDKHNANTGCRGPRREWRKTDSGREEASQPGTERRFEEYLQQEAQREDARRSQEVRGPVRRFYSGRLGNAGALCFWVGRKEGSSSWQSVPWLVVVLRAANREALRMTFLGLLQ